jgi:chaperone BCS1
LSYSKREGKTWIYTSTGYRNNWTKTCSKSHRSFESVILAEGVKEQILNDVQNFLQSADWYRQCGVPWRRGYLLYGPPVRNLFCIDQQIRELEKHHLF